MNWLVKLFNITSTTVRKGLIKVEVSSGIFVLSCCDMPRKITLISINSLHHYEGDYALGQNGDSYLH